MQSRSKVQYGHTFLALALVVLGSCSDSQVAEVPQQQNITVEFDPSNVLLDPGQASVVTAYVVEGSGQRVLAKSPAYSVEWSVSDPAVASVSANGAIATVTGIESGAAQLEAQVVAVQNNKIARRTIGVITRAAVTSMRMVSGNNQSGSVSTPLTQPLVVQALNRDGFGVRGAQVKFAVRLGNGIVTPQEVQTDELGFAHATLTLGPVPGQHNVEAWVQGIPSVIFQANAAVTPAFVEVFQGNLQQGAPGTALNSPIGVRVMDASLRPLPGVQVNWAVTAGGGQVNATSLTDNAGVATATWTLGAAGSQAVRASASGIYADFAANAVPTAADQLLKVAGDGQTGLVGAPLTDSLVVRVVDGQGNPKTGVYVVWTVLSGGGTASPVGRSSDAAGYVRTAWTSGSVAGSAQVRASAQNVGNVTFNATVQSGGSTPPPPPPPAPAVSRLTLTPQSVTLNALNAQTALSATAYDSNNQVVSGQTISYTSTNPMVAIVDNLGRVTAKAVGTAMIVATALCCSEADTTTVTVTQQLDSVGISPRVASLAVGATAQVSAAGYDANGNVIPGTPISWYTSHGGVATVTGGLIQGESAGTTYIKAVSGTMRDSIAVTVTGGTTLPPPPPPSAVLTTISLTPTNPSLQVGATQTFTATAKDQNGNTMSGVSFTWSSSNPSVMSVSNGVVTALAVGLAALNVTSNGVNASANVSVVASAPPPPPAAGTYAQHDFNDGTLGPFTTLNGQTCDNTGQCGNDLRVRNGRAEVRYERLDLLSAGDRNRGIKWVPASSAENTPFGGTLYVGAVWTVPSMTPTARTLIDGIAATLGLPYQTDAAYEKMQRKLIYVNPGRNNYFFVKIHALHLSVHTGVGGGAPCSNNPSHPGFVVHTFTPQELFDKPQHVEMELKRSSGVRVPDGEVKIWLNGVQIAHKTGFCTNDDTNTSWQVQIGQQQSYTQDVGELYSEFRLIDNLRIGSRR